MSTTFKEGLNYLLFFMVLGIMCYTVCCPRKRVYVINVASGEEEKESEKEEEEEEDEDNSDSFSESTTDGEDCEMENYHCRCCFTTPNNNSLVLAIFAAATLLKLNVPRCTDDDDNITNSEELKTILPATAEVPPKKIRFCEKNKKRSRSQDGGITNKMSEMSGTDEEVEEQQQSIKESVETKTTKKIKKQDRESNLSAKGLDE